MFKHICIVRLLSTKFFLEKDYLRNTLLMNRQSRHFFNRLIVQVTFSFILIFVTSQAMSQLIIQDNIRFLALGDSYTIGESVDASERWPSLLIDSLKARKIKCHAPKIIAVTGWRTDNLQDAIQKEKLRDEYSLVSLLIGVNNFYQGKSVESYKPEFEQLLRKAISLAGGNKARVFVLSIPDYGYTPFGKANAGTISKGIDTFNDANRIITEGLGVKYINITDISRLGLQKSDLVASDGLHPSGKMYAMWVERILDECTFEK